MSDRQQAIIVGRPHGFYKGGEKDLPCLRRSSFEHNEFLALPEVANTVDCDGYLRKGERPRDENGKPQLLPIGYRRIRRLTPIECERLQRFPDNWTQYGITDKISDTQRYKMLGNAVTVNVIKAIAGKIGKTGF